MGVFQRTVISCAMASIVPHAVKLLVVDDEPALRQMLTILLRRQGYQVVAVPGYAAAMEAIAEVPQPFPLVLSDLAMPDGSGLDVLTCAKQRSTSTEVILMTAHSTVENAIDAIRTGAFNFVTKPFDPDELVLMIGKALEKHDLVSENTRLRAQIGADGKGGLIGRSTAMRKVFDMVARIADTKTTVLLTGESGTGKERVARAIHDASNRKAQPFLVVNCGALPEQLMESELFGYEKGAFTGATAKHSGLIREADGGHVDAR
jgi:two-component system, NtrC family, response regulator PilR